MPITKATKVAQLLNNTTGFVKNTYVDSDAINTSAALGTASSAGTTVYSTLDDLPGSASTGAQAFVSSNNGLYIYNGSGWYKVALVNATPYWDSEAAASYEFTIDTQITVTLLASDSDGHLITYTATPDSDANQFITITKDSDNGRIFTLTPDSENEAPATSNTGTITFKASDGISFASTVSTFTLNFITIVDNSAETVLLMKAAGNSATNAAITYQNSSDASTGFTETGTPQASTFSPYRSGGYSGYFDGGNDYLQIGSNADMINWIKNGSQAAGTLEAWIYITSLKTASNVYTHPAIFANGATYLNFGVQNGQLRFYYWTGAQNYIDPSGATLSTHRWYHVALTQDSSNTLRIFLDGALVSTTTSFPGISWGTGSSGNNFFVGTEGATPSTSGWAGYIKDARISTTARYTSTFTPPTEPLTSDSDTEVLVCHLPYFVDGSSSPYSLTITDAKTAPFGPFDYSPWTADDVVGSVYFDGTGDKIYTPNSSDWDLSSGSWTIECWVYLTGSYASKYHTIYAKRATQPSSTTSIEGFIRSSTGALSWFDGAQVNSSGIVQLNTWSHCAWVHDGTNLKMFLNGKNVYDAARSVTERDYPLYIGGLDGNTAEDFEGSISDFRITKGTAKYSADFTPPTAPLSHDGSTTKMLMNNKSDANVYDASSSYPLKLTGNTISSTTQRKFTTSSSMYFDGTGDYITIDDGFNFGTGDFTFEFWLYPTENLDSAAQLFINQEASGSGVTWSFSTATYEGYNGLTFSYGQYGSYTVGKYANDVWPAQNTWTHLAVQRRNGTIAIFVNGTSQTLTTYNEGSTFSDGADLTSNYTSRDFFSGLQGYVQNLRITKGLGRYSANFTPPTAEFKL